MGNDGRETGYIFLFYKYNSFIYYFFCLTLIKSQKLSVLCTDHFIFACLSHQSGTIMSEQVGMNSQWMSTTCEDDMGYKEKVVIAVIKHYTITHLAFLIVV